MFNRVLADPVALALQAATPRRAPDGKPEQFMISKAD